MLGIVNRDIQQKIKSGEVCSVYIFSKTKCLNTGELPSKCDVIPRTLVFCTCRHLQHFSIFSIIISKCLCSIKGFTLDVERVVEWRWIKWSGATRVFAIFKYTRKKWLLHQKVKRLKIKHFILQKHVCPLLYQYCYNTFRKKVLCFETFLWYICRSCWCQKDVLPFLFIDLRLDNEPTPLTYNSTL